MVLSLSFLMIFFFLNIYKCSKINHSCDHYLNFFKKLIYLFIIIASQNVYMTVPFKNFTTLLREVLFWLRDAINYTSQHVFNFRKNMNIYFFIFRRYYREKPFVIFGARFFPSLLKTQKIKKNFRFFEKNAAKNAISLFLYKFLTIHLKKRKHTIKTKKLKFAHSSSTGNLSSVGLTFIVSYSHALFIFHP